MFQTVPITEISESPLNPRKHFEPTQLAELASSIKSVGIVEPLVVRPNGKAGRFEIVAGARRFRAAKLAALEEVPILVRELSDDQVLELMVIENNQRDDLDPIEEAAGYSALITSNPAKYSAAFIAERIGRSEKYVWDRMKLLDLIPEARQHLEHGRITAGHAILIARLKPKDQERVIDPGDGGLFENDNSFEWDGPAKGKPGPLDGTKAVSVRELEKWIATHVRFDVQQAAAAAPLDFGPVAERVEEAAAKPGRGKKVIALTFEHFVQPAARADGERTFGPRSFKFADGQAHLDTSVYPAKTKVFPRCEYAVLGVVAAGEKYGQAFDVCIARDKCDVHWKREIAEKEKNATLRAKGQSAKATRNEAAEEAKHQAAVAAEEATQKQWRRAEADLVAACVAKVKALKVEALISIVLKANTSTKVQNLLGRPKTAEDVLRSLVLGPHVEHFETWEWGRKRWADRARTLGVDVAGILKKHAPKAEPAQTSAVVKKGKAKAR